MTCSSAAAPVPRRTCALAPERCGTQEEGQRLPQLPDAAAARINGVHHPSPKPVNPADALRRRNKLKGVVALARLANSASEPTFARTWR